MTTDHTTPQALPAVANIELPFGQSQGIPHCPCCGARQFDDEWEATPCKHTAFFLLWETGDFIYATEKLEKAIDEPRPDDFYENLEGYFAKLGYDDSLLIINETSGGMACGPVWSTTSIGFDFSAE